MPGLRSSLLQIGCSILLTLGLVGTPGAGFAQDPVAVAPGPAVLVIDQDRLFAGCAFGKASIERERLASADLEAENKRIQAELVSQEQELTQLRKTLPAEEFAARAADFDQKVERIRAEQDAKARDLASARDRDVQAFLAAAAPVLGQILVDRGAAVILDKQTVLHALAAVDVTDEAILRIDTVLGNSVTAPP